MVTVLDRYTTSFNWAAFNFAAIWLRPQWYLLTDSVITDVQQAGLTMVTGGGYSASDVIPGHWALVRKSVFIGHTQERQPARVERRVRSIPVRAAAAPRTAASNRPGNYCLSIDEGVSHQVSNFGMYQRLFSVYDGPAFQDSNAYLNIKARTIDDCSPFVDTVNNGRALRPRRTSTMAGRAPGWPGPSRGSEPKTGDGKRDFCYMPNAAIGWKQPNGFYYPPAFHSANLFFARTIREAVDIRHFVVSPLFNEGHAHHRYRSRRRRIVLHLEHRTLFNGFAGNDRQTVLNDDDGTLTGYKKTARSINLDDFFNAPVEAIAVPVRRYVADQSVRVRDDGRLPQVRHRRDLREGAEPSPPTGTGIRTRTIGDWNRSCTSEHCYGVPLVPPGPHAGIADKDTRGESIRMMGQETGQRSTPHRQPRHVLPGHDGGQGQAAASARRGPCVTNVFKENETYYLFLIFAKEHHRADLPVLRGEGHGLRPRKHPG